MVERQRKQRKQKEQERGEEEREGAETEGKREEGERRKNRIKEGGVTCPGPDPVSWCQDENQAMSVRGGGGGEGLSDSKGTEGVLG